MAVFDKRLIDPTQSQLATVLGKAMAAANKDNTTHENLMTRDAAFWGRFALDVLKSGREGRRRSCKGGRAIPEVVAAWWTDPANRKHVRITGRTRRPWALLRGEAELRAMPSWWHIYPEGALGRRTADDESEQFLAVCKCGAVGSPESLGWMGDSCGPCFDRRAEGGTVSGGYGQFGAWASYLNCFSFSPDSRDLIAHDLKGCLCRVSREDGSIRCTSPKVKDSILIQRTNNEETLLGSYHGITLRWNHAKNTVQRVIRNSNGYWGSTAFAPDHSRAIMITYMVIQTASLKDKNGSYTPHTTLENHVAYQYAPDSSQVYLCSALGILRGFDPVTGATTTIRDDIYKDFPNGYSPPHKLAVAHDQSSVLLFRAGFSGYQNHVRCVPLPSGEPVDLRVPHWFRPHVMTYSPDNRFAVMLNDSGWIGFWEAKNGKCLGFVRAVLEDLTHRGGCLEFSPDGSALAVSYSTGHREHGSTIAVWPWPEILNAAKSE